MVMSLLPGTGSVVLALVVTLAALPLVPPEHLHRAGIEGRLAPIVHAHGWSDAVAATPHGASLTPWHGDHSLAITLNGELTPPSRAMTGVPGLPAAAMIAPQSPHRHRFARGIDDRRTHAPPAIRITRGPPSRS
jgi:hypothetical protein